jgi:acyl carrier protein
LAVAVPRGADATGANPTIVAYVVARSAALEARELIASVRARLPDYMVPAAVVQLEGLPMTANGKIDRARLPPADVGAGRERVHVPPLTPVEEALAEMWAELLGVARVGTTDNFFELGGHSLLGTQMVSRIQALFDIDVPLRRIFDLPTVGQLALAITELLLRDEMDGAAADAVVGGANPGSL